MNFAIVERDFIRSRILPDFDWAAFSKPSHVNPLPKALREARVALVTTCGAHTPEDPPFDVESRTGDPSYREIPNDIPLDRLRLSHPGYDVRKVREDINCVFPLERLREIQAEGIVGSLNHRHFSFMGYIPLVEPLLGETGPEVARKLRGDGVDLVLLAPAWPVCQQSVGLLQRVFDDSGLSTISLTLVKEITELVKPSRALFVEHPFGFTFGGIGDRELQRRILLDCLNAAAEIREPGTVLDLPYRWTRDNLRELQLQKKAH